MGGGVRTATSNTTGRNPADNRMRKKTAYIVEFTPWNWIIGASSCRDEFVELVKIDDLKKPIKPVRIKASGYFWVFDENYRVLIHPEFEDIDGLTLLNSQGRRVLEADQIARDSCLTYMWNNPSDPEEQLQLRLCRKARRLQLVSGGHRNPVMRTEMKKEGLYAFIRKPYNLAELSR